MGVITTPGSSLNIQKNKEMKSVLGILGIILGAMGATGHWLFTRLRHGPPAAVELLRSVDPVPGPAPASEPTINAACKWKVRSVGETLLTPLNNDYAAVIVHALMEDNFYSVRLLSDPSKYLHIHSSLLFSKVELDASNTSKN
jgi:hypothetical protein